MYTVVRQYDAAGELGDLMVQRADEVNEVIGTVPGFVAYYAARDGDQMTSITVCNDRAGVEESSRRAAAWVKENLPNAKLGAPTTRQGDVFIDFTKA
jgi:hypothetical protein